MSQSEQCFTIWCRCLVNRSRSDLLRFKSLAILRLRCSNRCDVFAMLFAMCLIWAFAICLRFCLRPSSLIAMTRGELLFQDTLSGHIANFSTCTHSNRDVLLLRCCGELVASLCVSGANPSHCLAYLAATRKSAML